MTGPIDSLKVGFGVDLTHLDSDLAQAKSKVDRQLPRERQIHVDVIVRPARGQIEKLQEGINKQLTSPIRIEPKLVVNRNSQSVRDFRRDIEQAFRQGGPQQSIRVPIQPVFRRQDFRQQLISGLGGSVTIPIKGEWQGWANGKGPPEGFSGPGPGRSRGPVGPSTAPSGQAAQSRPVKPQRAQQAPASAVYRQAPTYGTRTDVSSTDIRDYGTPTRVVNRQARRAARTANVTGRPVVAAAVMPADASERVDIGNVRQGAPVQELTDEQERREYARNVAARPTPPRGRFEQPGERYTTVVNGRTVSRIRPGASLKRQRAAEAQRVAERAQQRAQVLASPQFAAARDLIAQGFHGVPELEDLGTAFDQLLDPEFKGTFQEFQDAAEARVEQYAAARLGLSGKKGKALRRQRGIIGGYKRGDLDIVDPTLLASFSALDALKQYQQASLDPNYVVRKADNSLRGRGGKVGRVGGRNAGRIASQTVELARQKRQPRIKPLEVREPAPGEVFGFSAEDRALEAAGGQGLYDRTVSKRQAGRVDPALFPDVGERDYSHFATARSTPGERLRSLYLRQRAGRRGVAFDPFELRPPLFFAEGGTWPGISGAILRNYIGAGAKLPRPGSRARTELETKYLRGMRAQELRRAKPVYQQGGRSDPRWRAIADQQFLKDPFCAYCGRLTQKGALGAAGFRADHLVDVASGGAMYDPANVVTACNSCNSFKSGGRSARPLLPGQRVKQLARAEGGQISRTGLLARMAQAGHEPSITIVGERGPEGIVQDPNTGEAEVVPTHKLPEWLRRAQEGHGVAKDLTGRAEGGPLRIVKGGSYFSGGKFVSAAGARVGDVQRVFVTNWPAALTQPVAGINTTAARSVPQQPRAQQPNIAQQGQPPAGPPGAPATNARAVRPSQNPLLRTLAREAALGGEERSTSFEARLLATRARISEAQQLTPVRALSVAFGQIAQATIGGRSEIQFRERQAATLAGRAARANTQFQNLRQQEAQRRLRIADIQSGAETFATPQERASTLAALRAQGTQLFQARRQQRAIVEERTGRAETLSQRILTPAQQIRSQGAGLLGILGGTALFSGAVGAFSAIGDQIQKTLAPAIDAATGWTGAIQRATSAIADNVTALHGQAEAAAAGFAAGSGVSAQFFDRQGAGITSRGQTLAAQRAAAQGLDITNAAAGLNGSRFDRALFEGTGGLLGTNAFTEVFGGQEGFLQTIGKRIENSRAAGAAPFKGQNINAFNQGPINPLGFLFGQSPQLSAPANPNLLGDTIDDLNKNLANAAKSAGAVSDAFQLVTNATDDQKKAMIDSAASISDEARTRAEQFAAQGVAVVAGTGPSQRNIRGQEFGLFANELRQGTLFQDPALLLRATQAQRNAQAQLARIQGQFAQGDILSGSFLQNLSSPISRFGTTFSTAGLNRQGLASASAASEGQRTLENVEKYSKISADAQTKYLQLVQQGRQNAFETVGNIDFPSLTGQRRRGGTGGPGRGGQSPSQVTFGQLTNQIGTIGGQIRDITDSIDLRQVNYEVAQYNEQIRLTERSLGDAKDLWAAINGAQIKTVGGLQGANILLDRQNQLLSRRQQALSFRSEQIGFHASDLQNQLQQLQFSLQQRQINFSKAIAGFVAPGDTPAERAARIEEAKIEADYAQKQLDLQEQIAKAAREQLAIAKQQSEIARAIFANQNKQQDNAFSIQKQEAQRSITDLQKQLDQLFTGRALTIDSAAAQKTIEDLQKQVGPLEEQAKTLLQEGVDARSRALQDLADVSAQTGKDMRDLVSEVETAWQRAASSYINDFLTPVYTSIEKFNTLFATRPSQNQDSSRNTKGPFASGTSMYVDQPTQFVAGDAGGEQVFVIRNPKSGMWMPSSGTGGGGGGGVTFNGGINITIVGGKDKDDEETADRLARKVEERLNRKLAMIAG